LSRFEVSLEVDRAEYHLNQGNAQSLFEKNLSTTHVIQRLLLVPIQRDCVIVSKKVLACGCDY
jgi:hypothetical protein